MHERIKQVMADTFLVEVQEIPDDAAVDQFPRWDSLAHVELMLALETEFSMRIPTGMMLELLSLEAIDEYLRSPEARIPG